MSLFTKLFSLFNGVANSVGGGDKVSKKCEEKKPQFDFKIPADTEYIVISCFPKGEFAITIGEDSVECSGYTSGFKEKIEDGNSD